MLSGVRAQIAIKFFGDDLDALRDAAPRTPQRLCEDRRPRRPAGREAGAYPAARDPRRLSRGPRSTACSPRASTDQLAAPVQRPRRLAAGRWLRGVSTSCCASTIGSHHARPRRPADRDALGWVPVAPDRRGEGDRRPQPDPARERQAAHRRARQRRWLGRHGADRAAISARDSPRLNLPQGFFTATLKGTFQAQEEASRTIGLLSLLSLAPIFAILYSRYRSAVLAAHHHGQRAAGADRQRRRAVARRTAAFGRLA